MSKASFCNCGVGFFNPIIQIMCNDCLYDRENREAYHYNLMTCAVCNSLDYSYNLNIKHHISYFPEQIIKIHKKCHTRPKLNKVGLIQYTNDDYKKFYKIDCYKKNNFWYQNMNKKTEIVKSQKKYNEKLYHSRYNDPTYKGYFY